MQVTPREPNPFVIVIAALALLPGLAVVLYYALDPGLRAWLGWLAAWLLLWCGVCIFLLGRALKRRYATLRFPLHRTPRRTRPTDVAGPFTPF